jgi:lipopolysaccharide export system protein LptA
MHARAIRRAAAPFALVSLLVLTSLTVVAMKPAEAQQIDLSHGGPITITAQDGLELRQAEQEVIARGNAQAVRGNVTVNADELIAHYRKKAGTGTPPGSAPTVNTPTGSTPATPPAPTQAAASTGINGLAGSDTEGGSSEIYRLEAVGHVRISTPTDTAEADRAVYDLDQSVLVLTGQNLRIVTPNDLITARDSLEYWSQKHMAVARGDAVILTHDGRRVGADVLVAYTTEGTGNTPPAGQAATPAAPPAPATSAKPANTQASTDDAIAASGRLKKVEAFGHVSIRTATDTVTGDRGVYVPETGIARLAGAVRITRGQNQLNGAEAEVDLHTGVARLISTPGARVQGLVLPNDPTNRAAGVPGAAAPTAPAAPPATAPTPAKPGSATP